MTKELLATRLRISLPQSTAPASVGSHRRLWLGSALAAVLGFACASEPGTDANSPDSAVEIDSSAATDSSTAPDGQGGTDATATTDALVGADSGGAEVAQDAGSDAPADPCDKTLPGKTFQVEVPWGETLFLDGDDYLAFWGQANGCPVTLETTPNGAKAQLVAGLRLTPDLPGTWVLRRGPDLAQVQMVANYWTPDTFLNYNYAPTQPLVADPDNPKDGSKASLWVAATTSARVQRIDLQAIDAPAGVTATAGPSIATGSWPTALAVWPGTRTLVVTCTGRDSLAFVDMDQGIVIDAIRLGNEPHNLVIDGSGAKAKAWVALAGEDRVVRVDLTSRTVEASVPVGHEPRALALDGLGRRLYVASLISGNSHPLGPLQKGQPVDPLWQHDVAAIDIDAAVAKATLVEIGTTNRGLFIERDAAGQASQLLVATSLANNTKLQTSAETRPHAHHLRRIDLGLWNAGKPAEALVLDRDLDIDPKTLVKKPAASPYTVVRSPDNTYVVASLSAGAALLFVRPDDFAEVGRIATGHDPRGLVHAMGRLWTYAWLSNQVEGVELPAAPTLVALPKGGSHWAFASPPQPNVVQGVGKDPTPLDVRGGQQIFNDATFSKYGDFSCNNCHVDGLTDGLVWDLLVDGPVNTLAFRNIGGTEPFLWGGQLATLFDFSREVLKLVGATASGQQMELLTRYMQSVTAPPNPYALPGGKLTAAALAGKQLFGTPTSQGGAGCVGCHGGPLGTSQTTVVGKTPGKETDVPSLMGAYDTAPYGREGQWSTLGAMVDYAAVFTGAKLSAEQRKQVLEYVQQLPGDLLALNSARPLAGADHVWHQVNPELVFSAVLAPGQAGKFKLVQLLDGGTTAAVAGSWTVSGRAARFAVTGGKLQLLSKYRIDVEGGLTGALGQHLPTALQIGFATGGVPAFDVSGQWKMTLQSPAVGTLGVQIAVLMALGGNLTGVVLDNFQQGNLSADAITGVVSGTTIQLDPFYVESEFGKLYVKDGFASTLEDTNADGFADKGSGAFDFTFAGKVYPIKVTWKRTALPKGS